MVGQEHQPIPQPILSAAEPVVHSHVPPPRPNREARRKHHKKPVKRIIKVTSITLATLSHKLSRGEDIFIPSSTLISRGQEIERWLKENNYLWRIPEDKKGLWVTRGHS